MRLNTAKDSTATDNSPWTALLAYPPICPVCGGVTASDRDIWCEGCAPHIGQANQPICAVCHRYLDSPDTCCPSSHPAVAPGVIITLGIFDHAWRAIVHAFKYGGQKRLAESLSVLLAEQISRQNGIDAIVAVPTDPRKRRERGFGHAELLTSRVAANAEITYLESCLRHTRRIPDQTRLTGRQRAENLRGAFAVSDPDAVAGESILIVDDVTTTGATLREAARALSDAGATPIAGAVVAANISKLHDGR